MCDNRSSMDTMSSFDDIRLSNTRFNPVTSNLETLCTKCDRWFLTSFRRMKRGEPVVRNTPQCSACRNHADLGLSAPTLFEILTGQRP